MNQMITIKQLFFFFSSRRRHTRCGRDWSSDVCSSDLAATPPISSATSMAIGEVTDLGARRSEERRVGKSVDLGGRRTIKKKRKKSSRLLPQFINWRSQKRTIVESSHLAPQ